MSDAPDPASYHNRLETAALNLDEASKSVWQRNAQLADAEAAWFNHYDETADALKESMAEDRRKGDPAEHTIERVARREKPVLWKKWQDAKRSLKAAEVVSANRRQEVSAYQSLIKSEMTEAGAQDSFSQTPHADFRRGQAA